MRDPEEILKDFRTTINFDRDDLVPELLAFGEVEVATIFSQLDERSIAAIGVLASNYLSSPDRTFVDKAICLGAVEFIEGQSRPLRRKRRIYTKNV